MNLDELQSVQSRERQTDSLQQLRESFYADAGEFIQQLRDERDRAAERAEDPFDAPEVNRLTDDINTAEQTVEAIYERRVGKIVKMASLAAADMPAEEEGLTREERELFETLVGAIENNRDHVLDVLAGEASPGAVATTGTGTEGDSADASAQSEPGAQSESDFDPPARGESADATPAADQNAGVSTAEATANDESSVDAADVMGSADDDPDVPPEVPPDEPPGGHTVDRDEQPRNEPGQSPASDGGSIPSSQTSGSDGPTEPATPSGSESEAEDTPAVDRTTVRITDDIGEIFGVDQREYDLSTDDVVTLPAQNAEPLVERDAAESLE